MGRKLAKREEIEVERSPSKRPDRFTLEVRASMGILKRDMTLDRFVVACAGCGEGVSWEGRKGCCCAWCSVVEVMVSG